MRRTLLLAALLLAPLAALRAAEPPKPAGKPNIVFILFDDMGYGEPPCFRADSGFKTPNLDRLARQGMRFTDAHTAASVCTPTRYGLMTGRYPCRIGQYGVLDHFSPPIIEKQRTTVASLLRSQGYNTACLGKWHLGMNFVRHGKDKEAAVGTPVADGPVTRGFDIFCGYTEARSIGTIIGNDRIVAHDEPVEVQPMLAKKAEAYLEQRRPGQPFFLYVPLCVPHVPIVPSEEFTGKSRSGPYGDWILEGDAVVGQIMAALDRGKLAENTLLLVSSDNGAAKRVYAPLRGCKTSIYEGGHRVPFLARWPGKIKPGAVCDDTICLNDLLATCAEVVGAKLPDNAGEDSVSILPDLLRTAHHPVREATVHQSPAGELAIRQGPWKLIFFKGSRRELYNLQDDLSETRDQLAANPELVRHLTKLMEQYIANGRSTPGAVQKNDADISLDGKQGKAKGRGKAKQKQRARSKQEVNLAMDPDFD
jgi:arylsulfatase A-like enzyme